MIRQLCVLSLLLVFSQGKPLTYDQRQDGRFNVHAQLDNIMVVIATPADKGPSSFFSDIASQILEMRGLTSRHKKISIEEEEIVEQGKDPLNVRILRIEGQNDAEQNESQSQGRGSSNQVEQLQGQEAALNQIKVFGLPTIDDIKEILNTTDQDIKDRIKDVPNKTEEEKKTILDIKDKVIPEVIVTDKKKKEAVLLISEKQEIIPKDPQIILKGFEKQEEEVPVQFVSFGPIASVDEATDKVVYELKDKKSDQNSEKVDLQEKILLEKSKSKDDGEIIPQIQEKTTTVPQESENIQDKEVLPKKLENQEEKIPEKTENQKTILPAMEERKEETAEVVGNVENIVNKEKKLGDKIEDKIISKSERAERELRVPVNGSKGRKSLKKELPRIEDLKDEDAPGDKNEVRLVLEEISQLKPIGDMIENCGPGRIRNRYGVCQFDESFN